MIPGANILSAALSIIGSQTMTYYKFVNRATNDIGLDVAVYAPALTVRGSIQPVPRVLYAEYGLDLQKNYVNIFVMKNVLDIERDVSGDYFIYQSQKFQCQSKTDWYLQDGWVQILCVEVPIA